MSVFSSTWLIKRAHVILYTMIIALCVLLYFFWGEESSSKIAPLLGGIATGLFLVIIQFMFSWEEHIERDRLRLLGLKNVLENKRDRAYYGRLIKKANRNIDLMGKTGSHFLEDFADQNGTHPEAKVLLDALGRGVRVRFLLPNPSQLSERKRTQSNHTAERLKELQNSHSGFSYRYFNHSEGHSIFVADNDVIIGPFFPDLESMNTPALHVRHDAILTERYLEYFKEEWDRCQEAV